MPCCPALRPSTPATRRSPAAAATPVRRRTSAASCARGTATATALARCDIGAFELERSSSCPSDATAIAAYHYTITRGNHTLEVADLTGRVQPGDQITAFVTIVPDCTGVSIGLAAYQAQAPRYDPQLEQVLHAQDTRVVGTGQQQLAVAVPDCYFQVDLVVGPVLARIGPPSDYYRQRQVDYATGGTSVCPAFEAPASPLPLPETKAEAYRTYLGGVAR